MNNTNPRASFLAHRPWIVPLLVTLQMAATFACPPTAYGRTSQLTDDVDVLADFRRRVDQYMSLHDALQNEEIQPEQRTAVDQNQVSQLRLAMGIRAARHHARQGEIFTRAIAATLRAALNLQLRGAGAAGTRASIRDDAPARFALRVNGPYPDGASLPTAPPNVLEVLPPLPEGLEYRIVDTHLILMDVDAGIVVDYLFNVMCDRC